MLLTEAFNCDFDQSVEGGELFERVICDDFILTEKACSIFMRQICEAIEYVHSKHVVHLDMKVSAFRFFSVFPALLFIRSIQIRYSWRTSYQLF